jgi:predicted ATPase/class 3 adenylate cyclase
LQDPLARTTFLFTDVEGSTRLWEQDPERMRPALARHDAIARAAVEAHGGRVVKMTGDGMHAVFPEPHAALRAALALQQALADPAATGGLALRVRCGLHAGSGESRDDDYFGPAVNRAARIMGAAHGGQVLLSQAVAARVADGLPPEASLRDLGSVRLRDLSSPERVYQLVHPRLRRDFPALRSLEATPNNLPQQVSSFVGRERELAEARRLLLGNRLLTFAGTGGLGKTRLALQLAAEVLEDFPDGVWLVELAPVADPSRVAQAAASVLGVREDAARSPADVLALYVRERALLLVLDNCEHLVQGCAEFARLLLQAGPRLKILATSREALRVAGETIYAVPPLAVPAADATGDPGSAAAGRLFLERARAAQPAFRLTPENAAPVATICRQLDGIPLALELAAARTRAMSIESIAARLDDRFRLLARGDRTALPRQQSLRALIDWSHDLLAEPERVLLRRLSVFAGGWTIEAAEAVCADESLEAASVLDLLAQLVDKSLVVLEPGGERYRMLETIRQYARERLEAAREKRTLRSRHLAYYAALTARAKPELTGPGQGDWLARLDAERENLLAAHRWCDRAPDGAQAGLQMINAVKLYWFARGLLGLGLRLTEEALARPAAQPRNAARCRALFTAGQMLAFGGRYADAVAPLRQGLAIARELADEAAQLAALQPLALALLGIGDFGAARECAAQALTLAQKLGDKHQLMGAINLVAQLHRARQELDAAEPLYGEVMTLARASGDRENIAIGLLNLAMVAVSRGAHERARAQLLEAVAIAEEIGSAPAAQSALEVGAGLAASRSEWSTGALFYGAAEARSARSGLRRDPADEAFLAPWVERARRALGTQDYSAAEAEGGALVEAQALARLRAWLEAARAPTG